MRRHFLVLLCSIAPRVWAQAPACTPLRDDSILAKDLGAVIPVFRQIPSDTLLGSTPLPGSQHTFHHSELESLAQRYALRLDADASACFERAMEPLDRNHVLEAMRAALQLPGARIELAEISLYPVPVGRIEFGTDRLGAPASRDQRAPVLWRGDVVYGKDHRFAIWARARILARCNMVVAVENLRPGRMIEPSQLRVSVEEGFPIPPKQQLSMDQVVGMAPLRPIAAGSVLRPDLIARPNDVSRGDLVEIEVRSGAARLVLTARAESGGRNGETIAVRNLESNKIFNAQVAGKGKAIVLTDFTKAE